MLDPCTRTATAVRRHFGRFIIGRENRPPPTKGSWDERRSREKAADRNDADRGREFFAIRRETRRIITSARAHNRQRSRCRRSWRTRGSSPSLQKPRSIVGVCARGLPLSIVSLSWSSIVVDVCPPPTPTTLKTPGRFPNDVSRLAAVLFRFISPPCYVWFLRPTSCFFLISPPSWTSRFDSRLRRGFPD